MAKAGAPPKFNEAHINWVFWKIAANEPMGRKQIVQETGLGEGSIRTILERLDEYGLVNSDRAGRSLTDNGKKVLLRLKQLMKLKILGPLEMTAAENNYGVLVRGAAHEVKSGMEQRDAAISVGKSGATTLTIKKGLLTMPGFNTAIDMTARYPKDSEKILNIFDPEEGDVIVIGSEKDTVGSEEAAWVAASTLLT